MAKRTAGAFDIRNVIGALLAVYGVILLLMGIFGDEESSKTGGVNANLWAGLVMIVVGAVFLVWGFLKPVRIDVSSSGESFTDPQAPAREGSRPE